MLRFFALLLFLLGCSAPTGESVTSTAGYIHRDATTVALPLCAVVGTTSATSLDVTAAPASGGTLLWVYVNGTYYSQTVWSGTAGVPETKAIALPAGTDKRVELVCHGTGPGNVLLVTDVVGLAMVAPTTPRVAVIVLGDSTSVPNLAPGGWVAGLPHNLPSDFEAYNYSLGGVTLNTRVNNITDTLDLIAEIAGDSTQIVLYTDLCINDYALSAATFAQNVRDLRIAARARFGNIRFIWQSATTQSNDATPNAFGDTFQDLRDAEEAEALSFGDVYSPGETILDYPGDVSGDGKHPNAAGQAKKLTRALAMLAEEPTMGTFSAAARNAHINHVRNVAAHTPAANHYFHLKVNGSYFSGNNYAVKSFANNKTSWSDAAGRSLANDVAVTYDDPTGVWFTDADVVQIEVSDNATPGAGLIIGIHTLDMTPFPAGIDDTTGPLTLPIGAIVLTYPAGGFTNTVVHEWLDLLCGATANSPRATVYGTYFVGQPSGAGTETSATRTAITQASTWDTAANGLARTLADIALADEGDATWYAEYSASSGGTLLFEAELPELPSGGIIPAGALRTSLQ